MILNLAIQTGDFTAVLADTRFKASLDVNSTDLIVKVLAEVRAGALRSDLAPLRRGPSDDTIEREMRHFLATAVTENGLLCPAQMPRVATVGDDWNLSGQIDVSPMAVLNFCLNALIKKRHKLGVVLTARDEGPWILEWLAHYRLMGVEKFIIYHNDTTDGMLELIGTVAEHFDISLIESPRREKISPQQRAYRHAIQIGRHAHEFEWVAFLDADEFLFVAPELQNIPGGIFEALKLSGQSDIDTIVSNWRWFPSQDCFKWVDTPTTARFTRYFKHNMKKCLFRPEATVSMHQVHFPSQISSAVCVTPDGTAVENVAIDNVDFCSDRMYLNHYFARSFEEFALKKSRGRPSSIELGLDYDFGNFAWGGGQPLTEFVGLEAYQKRIDEELRAIMSISAVVDARAIAMKRSASALQKLASGIDLAVTYGRLTGYSPNQAQKN